MKTTTFAMMVLAAAMMGACDERVRAPVERGDAGVMRDAAPRPSYCCDSARSICQPIEGSVVRTDCVSCTPGGGCNGGCYMESGAAKCALAY